MSLKREKDFLWFELIKKLNRLKIGVFVSKKYVHTLMNNYNNIELFEMYFGILNKVGYIHETVYWIKLEAIIPEDVPKEKFLKHSKNKMMWIESTILFKEIYEDKV